MFVAIVIFVAIVLTLVESSGTVAAQDDNQSNMAPPYNPYPTGILPPDLVQELERVRREIRGIEAEAIGQWHTLRPVT